MSKSTTHFGSRQVSEEDKATLVRGVFDSVVDKYDLMNDLMSLGSHRLWKSFVVRTSGVHEGNRVLDVAAGSGDLATQFARKVGPNGAVILTDINASMLQKGRKRMVDQGLVGNVYYVQADAERLPFTDNYFDCICIGFGLRNVTRQERALASMFACLRPGGRLMVLEFSKPTSKILASIYDIYSFGALPKLGRLVAKDEASYKYLIESIRQQPTQDELQATMEQVGFERVGFNNLAGGIVAVHTGYKF
ncbi:MAG: bifunctional demethylmenaquinone methyltransferase/2-methoxy-6-polyprenyl-1,4-benzoquinol methylase UbiE [Arenicellales bacterium]|nr:bifunctional demethylmenaquinone methyltransferase/2-methoxy-6-polyprenyl-1,4-benzoquinol methylase UbiE [Arenicellales bacterium]